MRAFFSKPIPSSAQPTPIAVPNASCFTNISALSPPAAPPLPSTASIITVSIYAQGSLLPLSISNIEAELYFRFRFLERSMLNTEAASVELSTAPISSDCRVSMRSTKWQKATVSPAVSSVPPQESSSEGAATFFASDDLAPKPP